MEWKKYAFKTKSQDYSFGWVSLISCVLTCVKQNDKFGSLYTLLGGGQLGSRPWGAVARGAVLWLVVHIWGSKILTNQVRPGVCVDLTHIWGADYCVPNLGVSLTLGGVGGRIGSPCSPILGVKCTLKENLNLFLPILGWMCMLLNYTLY